MTRAEKVAEARRLLGEGLRQGEIAVRMGVNYRTVSDWINDPDGSKARARKDSYRGTCQKCGARTDGSNGAENAPDLCLACEQARRHDERYWTQERIIEAIHAFVAEFGRRPSINDFNPAMARVGRPLSGPLELAGRRVPRWPIIQREFGTWTAAVRAAGLEPYTEQEHDWGPGRPSKRLAA